QAILDVAPRGLEHRAPQQQDVEIAVIVSRVRFFDLRAADFRIVKIEDGSTFIKRHAGMQFPEQSRPQIYEAPAERAIDSEKQDLVDRAAWQVHPVPRR